MRLQRVRRSERNCDGKEWFSFLIVHSFSLGSAGMREIILEFSNASPVLVQLDHSYRNATIGSTREARRAGTKLAANAMATKTAVATGQVSGSLGCRSKSS